YLGSFAATPMPDVETLRACLEGDLSAVAGAPVSVELVLPDQFATEHIEHLAGECIDDAPVVVSHYGPPQSDFLVASDDDETTETLVSHLLKSNCPVTGQP